MAKKVSIIGAGNVGATTAHLIALKGLADVAIVDVVDGLPQGKSLDMRQAGAVENFKTSVKGSNDYSVTDNSDVIVVTAGLARKPGMTRDELFEKNSAIIRSVIGEAVKHSPRAIFVIVTNPLDIIVRVAMDAGRIPKGRILGMSGGLDSARFRTFIAEETGALPEKIKGLVIGAHSDAMVPLPSSASVGGRPLKEVLSKEKILEMVQKTRNGGTQLVELLKTGSAFYAPASAITEIVEAIIKDSKKVIPCCVLLEGEYGFHGFMGVPARIGAKGVEGVVELDLDDWEREELRKSIAYLKGLVKS